MKKLKWLLLALVLTGFTYGQGNLIYDPQTWANTFVSDTIDLGFDTEKVMSDYGFVQQEARAVGLWFDGTWTNTSFTVSACTSLTGTYDPVQDADGVALTITMASNIWVWLEPRIFAGMRFIQLSGSAEGGARNLVVIRRRY